MKRTLEIIAETLKAFFGFIGQRHVWLTIVIIFLLVFGLASIDEITRAVESIIRAWRGN